MSSLLIQDVHTLVTGASKTGVRGQESETSKIGVRSQESAGTGEETILEGAYIYIEDGVIRSIGTGQPPRGIEAERVIDGRNLVAVPGLINTHHHLYQTLTRAVTKAANAELFDWLKTLYPMWARIDEEAVYTSSLVGMAELMLSGCTTTSDHHYVFPRGETKLIDAQVKAAREIGIRFHATRGSMSVGVSQGGLPPDSVVQDEDAILADSERVIRKYHDAREGAMCRVALAPCSPFSVSPELMKKSAEMAERFDVRLHTHLAETKDEEHYCRDRFGKRPVELLDEVGWMTRRTWVAHGIYFSAREIRRLGKAGVGVAHCPTSNMRLASGFAPALKLLRAGAPVGLGVDGSASNDGSHMLAEARQALLLQRVANGSAAALSVEGALRMATVEGARCLGREDIGTLAVGKRADIAMFDLRNTAYSGAEDPVSALLLCAPTRVHTLVVEGRVVVEDGELKTVQMEGVHRRQRRIAKRVVG